MTMRTIHDLVARYGTTARTLRFYEEAGLFKPHRRRRERLYDDAQVALIDRIMAWRAVGLPVSDIQRILMDGADEIALLRAQARAVLRERHDLEAKAARLNQMMHARFAEADAA